MKVFEPRTGQVVRTSDGRLLHLDQELGKGGEGTVWSILEDVSLAGKFYHNGLTAQQVQKIEAMCRLKSPDLLRVTAWPLATLAPETAIMRPSGFLMPRIRGYREAHLLYTPKSRRIYFPDAQFPFLVHVSINVARAFATVHDAGQVIGDVNHGNLMVGPDATVALIDCDSFQIHDGRTLYPCLVGVPSYMPPELQGRKFEGITRTRQHDEFGLAVLIFHLLFLGRHPFAGVFRKGTAEKTIEEAIREFRFAYLSSFRSADGSVNEMEPPPAVPLLSDFPAELGKLFTRAFQEQRTSGGRPSAHEWLLPLENLSRSLVRCSANVAHYYYGDLKGCPWCRLERAVGHAMFGARPAWKRTAQFDLVAVWKQIESVRADVTVKHPISPTALMKKLHPDKRLDQIWKKQAAMRAVGIVLMAVAILMFWSRRVPIQLSIGLMMGTTIFLSRFWKASKFFGGEIREEHETAAREYEILMRRWPALEKPPEEFLDARRRLSAEATEYAELAATALRPGMDLSSRDVGRREALTQSLSNGAQELRKIVLPWQTERATLVVSLNERAKVMAQAEVNLRALDKLL